MKIVSKKSKIIFTIICLSVTICLFYAFLYFKFSVFSMNNLDNGIVDIELKEYGIDSNGRKVRWQGKINAVPGEKISKIIEISCKPGSAECYIRTKIEIKNKDDKFIGNEENLITIDNLDIDKTKWFYCIGDGYWYYNLVLKDNSNSAIFNTQIELPTKITNKFALEEFEIDVKVESIQAKDFTPNFNEDSKEPWFGINQNDIKIF